LWANRIQFTKFTLLEREHLVLQSQVPCEQKLVFLSSKGAAAVLSVVVDHSSVIWMSVKNVSAFAQRLGGRDFKGTSLVTYACAGLRVIELKASTEI
jgi:hypothetical protein